MPLNPHFHWLKTVKPSISPRPFPSVAGDGELLDAWVADSAEGHALRCAVLGCLLRLLRGAALQLGRYHNQLINHQLYHNYHQSTIIITIIITIT
jgi:hypothetical protein